MKLRVILFTVTPKYKRQYPGRKGKGKKKNGMILKKRRNLSSSVVNCDLYSNIPKISDDTIAEFNREGQKNSNWSV